VREVIEIDNIHILFIADTMITDVHEISTFLESQVGFHVVCAASREQAKERIKKRLPDVVLLNSILAPLFYAAVGSLVNEEEYT